MAAIKFKLFGLELSSNGGSSEKEEVLAIGGSLGGGGDDPVKEKKAEKVVLCPRCNSQDTKFCYFNNYNVNQPRHFCRTCQRYWTFGGAIRNVPVGSGRRKNTKPATPLVRLKAANLTPLRLPKSSFFDAVVRLPNQSLSTSTDAVSLILSREALPKASSKECLDASEPSLEPINPSPFHTATGPCTYGYGLGGVMSGCGGHGTRPWNAPPWSPTAMAPLLDKRPGERLQAAITNSCILIPLEENRPDSLVSTDSVGISS